MKNRRKGSFLAALFMSVFSVVTAFSAGVSAAEATQLLLQVGNPHMIVNNVEAEIDPGMGTSPVISEERTLVPIRAIIEAFGGSVVWDGSTGIVSLVYEEEIAALKINDTTAYVNGEIRELDVPAQIIGDRTMLPIRFVAESFGLDVMWDGGYSTISITNNGSSADVPVPESWKTVPEYTAVVSGSEIKVHFIDVGQGDSIFAELPNGQTMLIDAGPSENTTADYIRGLGYGSIDFVIATHPDADHITGMPRVLESFAVGRFYMPEKSHTTKIFERMLDAIANNGCEAIYASAGNTIIALPEMSASFVAPVTLHSDNNDCSAVVRLCYKDNSFLFTGDAGYEEEADMINAGYDLRADVLKIGHHGSSSSTSEEFLWKVDPKYAVISCGANNKYGHPTQGVLNILNYYNIEIHRTDLSGTIIITGDGTNYIIEQLGSSIQINAPPEEVYEEPRVREEVWTPQEEVTAPKADSGSGFYNNNSYTAPVYTEDNSSQVVYRTKTGAKYHRDGCRYLSKSKIQTTVGEAKRAGLTPCSVCNPPQ